METHISIIFITILGRSTRVGWYKAGRLTSIIHSCALGRRTPRRAWREQEEVRMGNVGKMTSISKISWGIKVEKLWFPRNCSTKPRVRNWLELHRKGWYAARAKAYLLRSSNNENMVRMPSWAKQVEFRTKISLIWTFTVKTMQEAAARETSQLTTIQTTEEALLLRKSEKERQAAYQLLLGATSRQEGNPRTLSIIYSLSWQNSREPANRTRART